MNEVPHDVRLLPHACAVVYAVEVYWEVEREVRGSDFDVNWSGD